MGSKQSMCDSCPELLHSAADGNKCVECQDFYNKFNKGTLAPLSANDESDKYTATNVIFLTRNRNDTLWTVLKFTYDCSKQDMTLYEHLALSKVSEFVIVIPKGVYITSLNGKFYLPDVVENDLYPQSKVFMAKKLTRASFQNFKEHIYDILEVQKQWWNNHSTVLVQEQEQSRQKQLVNNLTELIDKIDVRKITFYVNILALNDAINYKQEILLETTDLFHIKVLGMEYSLNIIKKLLMDQLKDYTFDTIVSICSVQDNPLMGNKIHLIRNEVYALLKNDRRESNFSDLSGTYTIHEVSTICVDIKVELLRSYRKNHYYRIIFL